MAMQKEALWQLLTERNPHWVSEGANLTAAGLRKLFDTVFDQGHALGLENGKALAAPLSKAQGNMRSILEKAGLL